MISVPVNLSLHHAVESEYSLKCVSAGGGCLFPVKNLIVLSREKKNTFYFSLQMSDPFFVTGPHLPSLHTVCCCEHFWNSWAMSPDNSFTTLKFLKKNFRRARSVILLMIICLTPDTTLPKNVAQQDTLRLVSYYQYSNHWRVVGVAGSSR